MGRAPLAEAQLSIFDVKRDDAGAVDSTREDTLRELIEHHMLDDAAYRTCPELGVVAFLADPFNCSGRIAKLDAIDLQEAGRAVELDADDLVDLAATQRGEDDGLIDTVEELWTDRLLQKAEYQLTRLVDSSLLTARGDVGETLTDEVGAEVARHDDDRILEVHQTALIIRQTTVIEDLQEDVEDVGVSLLDLVEEDDGVGLAADRFGELTTFVIAYISWRRTDETGGGELLLILAHIDTGEHRLVIEEDFSQRLCQLGLPDTGGTEEDE